MKHNLSRMVILACLVTVLGNGLVLMLTPQHTFAASEQSLTGTVLMISTDMYVIRDATGKGVLLTLGKGATVDPGIQLGDLVEAQLAADGQARAIKLLPNAARGQH